MDNHQNMEIFREVVDHMATGLVVNEPVNNGENFRIREINNAGLKIGRQKREHVVGRLVTDVYPGVVDLGLFEVFQKVFKTGKAISFPLNYYRDERIDLWVENHVFKLPSGDVVAVYQDVTESEKTKQILEKRNREFETQNEELAAQNEELVALNEEIRQTYDQLNDLTNKSTIEKDKAQNYLDIAGVMFIALNHKGVVTLCNKKASEVLGYNENEITGRNWFDNFLPYRNLAAVKNVFAELIQGNIEPVEFYENPVITSAGEERIIAWHNAILRNDNGEITGLLSSGEDITESEKAAQKLTEAKKDWEAVFEAIGHPTIILNKNFQLIHANKSTEKLTGKPLSDLIGMHCFKVFHSEKATCAPGGCPMNALINKGEIKTVEMEMEAFGGYYLVSCTPVFDDQGEIQKVIHIATDITERKKAETALKVNEERFDLAMQAANDGLYDWDLVTNQIYYSPRWKGMLGYEDHELKSDFSVWERLTEPGDVKRSWEMLNELIEKKRDRFEMEFKMLHKDGHWVDILSRANAIFDENGKAFRVVGTHVDISEKKRQELILIKNQDQISRQYKKLMALNEELKEFVMRTSLINEDLKVAKERAEQSDRLKSAFLANMSHEIRTPMNGILGFADLLKEPGLTGDQHQKYIRIIEQSGKRMLSTINDLIDISRIESGAMEVSVSETNVNQVIENIGTFFGPEASIKGLHLSFVNGLPKNLAITTTDSEKLYAILLNLVKNAIKYTHEGSVDFGYEKKGNNLEFYVKDTGIGITGEKLEIIFERFVQAEDAIASPYEGSGLGLAISKAFVEMLGGQIWVESTYNAGTTFYFSIPLVYKTLKISKKIPHVSEIVAKSIPRGLKVLVVEDTEVSKEYLSEVFTSFYAESIFANDGSGAVELCRNNPDLDLVMMDIRMPVMDGYAATRKIREFNRDVVIIAQTAFALAGDREKALEAGCDDYIAKPVKKGSLLAIVTKHFG